MDSKANTLTKIAFAAGIIAVILPPLLYELYLFIEAGSEMMFNATSGVLPPPPKHLPSKFLKNYPVYGHIAKYREKQILGMRQEFENYLQTGKHPLAAFPPPPERRKMRFW